MTSEIGTAPDPHHAGIRGWLLLLCLYLTILVPLVSGLGLLGVFLSASISPSLQSAILLESVFQLGLGGFALYAGLALFRKRANAVSMTKIYFILNLTLGLLGLGLVLVASLNTFTDLALGSFLRGPAAFAAVREIVTSGVWLAYLERSKRVRATFTGA